MADRVSLKLTKEQMEAIKQATGKDATELQFSVRELEERIAPARLGRRMM